MGDGGGEIDPGWTSRRRRDEGDPLTGRWMVEGEACGVERQRTDRVPRRLAVEPVTKDRAADGAKVHAELVRASCKRLEFHEADGLLDRDGRGRPSTACHCHRPAPPFGDEPPGSCGVTTLSMLDLVSRWMGVIAREWKRDRAGASGGLASHYREVSFGDTSLLKGDAEGRAGFPGPREDEQS